MNVTIRNLSQGTEDAICARISSIKDRERMKVSRSDAAKYFLEHGTIFASKLQKLDAKLSILASTDEFRGASSVDIALDLLERCVDESVNEGQKRLIL